MDQNATEEPETDSLPQDEDLPTGSDSDYNITYRGLRLPPIVMQGHGIRRPWDY